MGRCRTRRWVGFYTNPNGRMDVRKASGQINGLQAVDLAVVLLVVVS